MATGTVTLNFGVTPASRKAHATVDVTGLSGLTSASYIEAFTMAESSANHSADEIMVDKIHLTCQFLTAASFRVHGVVEKGRAWGDIPLRWVTA